MKNYQTGYWLISEGDAENLHGQHIYLHKAQKEPSYFGGVIESHRMEIYLDMPRVVFIFKPTLEQKGVKAPRENWGFSVEKQRAEDGIHLLHKGPSKGGPGLFGPVEEKKSKEVIRTKRSAPLLALSFGSKIGRREYWERVVAQLLFGIVTGSLGYYIGSGAAEADMHNFNFFVRNFPDGRSRIHFAAAWTLAPLLLYSMVYHWNNFLGRVRDINQRPFLWVVGYLVPVVSLVILIVVGCMPSAEEE